MFTRVTDVTESTFCRPTRPPVLFTIQARRVRAKRINASCMLVAD